MLFSLLYKEVILFHLYQVLQQKENRFPKAYHISNLMPFVDTLKILLLRALLEYLP